MKDVILYTTDYCGFCRRAKQLLERKGVPYKEIDVSGDDEMRARLVEMTGGLRTVPQIWIGEEHVGGYSDLAELEQEGRLDELLGAKPQPGA